MGLLTARARFCRHDSLLPRSLAHASARLKEVFFEHHLYIFNDQCDGQSVRKDCPNNVPCPPIRTRHLATHQVVYLKQQRYDNTGHRQNVFTRIANPLSINAAAGHSCSPQFAPLPMPNLSITRGAYYAIVLVT